MHALLLAALSVWAEGRFAATSPATTAAIAVNLADQDVAFGSSVRLRYGFGDGSGAWAEQHEIAAPAVAPWTFRAELTEELRGFTKLEFVFVITGPDGRVRYEKGGDSVWGYYEAALPAPGTITDESTEPQRLVVYPVDRN
jgi:hypothetical protein